MPTREQAKAQVARDFREADALAVKSYNAAMVKADKACVEAKAQAWKVRRRAIAQAKEEATT